VLTNDTWVYGSGDDTLYRLIALGTDELVTYVSHLGRGSLIELEAMLKQVW
jgi:hypothetical protein